MRTMVSFMLWTVVVAGYLAGALAQSNSGAAATVNPVVSWNRTLLVIVRTKGAQPATVHPTRSFAIMHAAMYDAVNAIDRSHEPYLVELERVPAAASQDAAACVTPTEAPCAACWRCPAAPLAQSRRQFRCCEAGSRYRGG